MRKRFLPLAAFALVCLFSATASATANFVYHEQTANFVATPTCPSGGTDSSCGRYVENTDRSGSLGFQIYSPETYSLHYKVEYQFFTNQARIYYTTDGTTPSGSFGTGFGTTQVATASYSCTYSDQTQGCQIVDVISASIPAQSAGTTVKYIVGAWHSGGGPEVFGNSGTCTGCFSCTDSTTGCTTVFEYNVIAPPTTPLIISEFRLRGPGLDGSVPSADDDDDEFIEIYNNSNSDVTVNAFDGSAGFAVVAADGITRFTIPNGTVIPARGHYLGVNSVGYSLGSYPAATRPTTDGGAGAQGSQTFTSAEAPTWKARLRSKTARAPARNARGTTGGQVAAGEVDTIPGPSAATGDVSYTTQIADNVGIALFNTANPLNFSEATRLDAVGSTSELNTLFKEGSGYPAILPTSNSYSFYRSLCSFVSSCTTLGLPKDTGDNASDFLYVSTDGTDQGAGARLGAPGPENSTSPVQRNASFGYFLLDSTKPSSSPPNRERDFTEDSLNNSTFGTLTIRRRVTNNTGANVTRLRFRVIEITTAPASTDYADVRAISSSDTLVSGIEDPDTCAGLPTPCVGTVLGTTLEEASSPNDQPNGGGFNSSLSAGTITLLTPLAPTDNPATIGVRENEIKIQLMLGIERTGRFRFLINIEALP